MSALIARPSTGEVLVDETCTGDQVPLTLTKAQLDLVVSALRTHDEAAQEAAAQWRRQANDLDRRAVSLEHAEVCDVIGRHCLSLREELIRLRHDLR